MAGATITTPDGILIEVTGTPEEVAAIVEKLRSSNQGIVPKAARAKDRPKSDRAGAGGRVLIQGLIETMKEEDFFKSPKGLGDIRQELANMGHHYPLTTLSGTVQRITKKRQLRRFKQDGKYVYVRA